MCVVPTDVADHYRSYQQAISTHSAQNVKNEITYKKFVYYLQRYFKCDANITSYFARRPSCWIVQDLWLPQVKKQMHMFSSRDFIHRHVIITRRDNNYGFAIIGTLRRQGRIQDFFVAYFWKIIFQVTNNLPLG